MNAIPRSMRHGMYLTGGILLATGVVWAPLHYTPGWMGIGERAAMSVNVVLMKLHGAAAMFSLVLLGMLLAGHVSAGWRSARNRGSGTAMLLLVATLIVTGYLLYYAGGEDLRQAASGLHVGAGVILPTIVLAHAYRRTQRRYAVLARLRRRRRRLLASLR